MIVEKFFSKGDDALNDKVVIIEKNIKSILNSDLDINNVYNYKNSIYKYGNINIDFTIQTVIDESNLEKFTNFLKILSSTKDFRFYSQGGGFRFLINVFNIDDFLSTLETYQESKKYNL